MDYSKVNIFYPVIGYTGMVHSDYMMSTINLMSVCRQKNIKIGFITGSRSILGSLALAKPEVLSKYLSNYCF